MTSSEQLAAEFERVNAQAPPALVPVLRVLEQAQIETRRRLEDVEKRMHA